MSFFELSNISTGSGSFEMLKTLSKLLLPRQALVASQYCRVNFCTPGNTTTPDASAAAAVLQPEFQEKDKLFSKLELELKCGDPAVMRSYARFATTSAHHLGIEVGNCLAVRKPHHDRMTLLKSVHIYKKHRVQYEVRTYFHYLNFHKLTGSTLDTFLEYIERNLPEGVALKATKVELQPLPEHLKEPPSA